MEQTLYNQILMELPAYKCPLGVWVHMAHNNKLVGCDSQSVIIGDQGYALTWSQKGKTTAHALTKNKSAAHTEQNKSARVTSRMVQDPWGGLTHLGS